MNEVVINNIERTKFYGYCPNPYKLCKHLEIEFPKSELEKLEPFVREGGVVKFENEDGTVEEWNRPPMTYVKNRRFIYNNRLCDILGAIGFRTNERGEEMCYAFAFFPIQD
jgi:hypothetical protein